MARSFSQARRLSRWTVSAAAACAFAFGFVAPAQAEEAPARIEVGQAAPDFSLESSDGKTYTLSEMKDRKSIVLIFFRGTW